MYQTAKKAREAMKSKAKRLASDRPLQKVDSSTFTPPEMLKADVKTGLRPVSRRAYKSGGKVDGSCGPMRADRKQRKSGGKTEAVAYANAKVNRNVKDANEDREGEKHVGGLKRGGAAYARGGSTYADPSDKPRLRLVKTISDGPKSAKIYKDLDFNEHRVKFFKDGKHIGESADYHASDRDDAIDTAKYSLSKEMYRGGRAKKYDGGPLGGANRMMAAASQRAAVPNAMLGFSGVKRGALSPMRATGLKKGGKADDTAQDKALVKKAMRQHETAQHGGKHSELKLRRGGYAKKQDGGGMSDYPPPPPPPPPADYRLTPADRRMIRQGQDPFGEGIMPSGGRPNPPPPARRRAAGGKTSDIERVLSRATEGNPDPKRRYVSYAGTERRPSPMSKAMDPIDEQMAESQREAKPQEMYRTFRAKKAAAARKQKMEDEERRESSRMSPMLPPTFKHGGEANRMARASGGRAKKGKGKTNINIVIDAGGAKPPMGLGALPPLPLPGGRPVPPPMPVGGLGAAPMGMPAGPMPPAAPPPAMPGAGPMPMGRKHGGRTMSYKDMTAGAGSGAGRLQKTEIEMHKRSARRAGGKVYRSYMDMDAGAGSGLGRLEKTEIASRK